MELRTELAAGGHAAVLTALFDLDYLEARCRTSVAALLEDLAYVLREAPTPLPADASFVHPSGAHLGRGAVAILETLLSVHRERVEHRPARLFQFLHDELYWYDAPTRAEHHDGPLAAPSDWELWRWAEHARAIFEARPGACWLRCLRPPRIAGAALPSWRLPGEVRALSRDGASLLLEARGGDLNLVDVKTGSIRTRFVKSDRGRFSSDGSRLVTCSGPTATVWATATLTPLRVLGPHAGDIQRIIFSSDGQLIFTMSTKQLRAWRVVDGSCVTRTTSDYIEDVLPCGAGAVVFHERGAGWLRWDGTNEPTRATDDAGSYYPVVAVSPAGDRLVQQRDDTVDGWALPDGRRQFHKTAGAMALAFHPNGACFIGSDGIFRDAMTGSETGRLRLAGGTIADPSFDPLGRFLLTRHDDAVWLWDLAMKSVVAQIKISIIGAHWSDDGSVLAIGERGSTLIMELAALAPAARWRDDARPVGYSARAQFSPSGATLVVDHDGSLGFWDTARGVIRTYADATKYMGMFARGCCVLGRHANTLIAFAIEDGVELWRTQVRGGEQEYLHAADEVGLVLVEQRKTGAVVALGIEVGGLRYQLAGVSVVALDRDVLLTRTQQTTPGAFDGVTLRATATGAVSLELPTRDASTFAISPDHRWLAACRSDIDLWDLKTQTVHRTITPGARSFRFREDSAALITYDWVIHQSGNQDSNSEYVFDVVTGACVSSRGWSGDDQAAPREIAPGILLEGGQLRVDGTELELPIDPVVYRTEAGEVVVASVFGRRVELYALKPDLANVDRRAK